MITREEIIEHCERAKQQVAKWPAWERDILENSLRPERETPRNVVWLHVKQPVCD